MNTLKDPYYLLRQKAHFLHDNFQEAPSAEPYTFSKSTLNNMISPFNLASSTTLFSINTPSTISRPWMKVDRTPAINLSITFLSIFLKTLYSTFYIHPTKDIGLKSFNFIGLSLSGIRAMDVLFIPFAKLSFSWNSNMNKKSSPIKYSRKFFKKPKVTIRPK